MTETKETTEFPKGVRPICFDDAGKLGVHEETGKLYWGNKELATKSVVSLRKWEFILALFATFAAFGTFLIELCRYLQGLE